MILRSKYKFIAWTKAPACAKLSYATDTTAHKCRLVPATTNVLLFQVINFFVIFQREVMDA